MICMDPLKDEFVPVGIILCPDCGLSSLSWNIIYARCGHDLMPDEDDAGRHKQENAA